MIKAQEMLKFLGEKGQYSPDIEGLDSLVDDLGMDLATLEFKLSKEFSGDKRKKIFMQNF